MELTSRSLGLLRVWEIPEEYPSLSDHELILLEWEDLEMKSQEKHQPAMKRWSIQNLLQDENLWQAAKEDWEKSSTGQKYLTPLSTKDDFDKEVEWFENKIAEFLNNRAKITRVCAYFKRWWNEEVAEARRRWARDKRKFGGDENRKQELKQAWNSYYRTIRKAKRLCWQNFLQGEMKTSYSRVKSWIKTDAGLLLNIPNRSSLKSHRHLETPMEILPPP